MVIHSLRQGDIDYIVSRQSSVTQNQNGMDTIAHRSSPVPMFSLSWQPTGGTRFQQSCPNRKPCFAAPGSSGWTHGGTYVSTAVQIITPNLPFGIALSWVYVFSVTQEVIHCSDTSWAQSTTLGFIIQVTPNIALQMSQPSRCQRLAI